MTVGGQWPDVLALVGPTASGKSEVAVEVARLVGGEVVNADAFQVYRGMDIGTAKVPPSQRRGVPHHLVDILDVTEELSVADFQDRGRAVLRHIGQRGAVAIVVGGSGLYVRALLDDLRLPGSDPQVRARYERVLAESGPQTLHRLLAERDPQAAAHILPTNGRRIVRALEVGELTGGGFVAQLPASGPPLVDHCSVGLDVPRAVLDERISARVDAMFSAGLVEEVRALLSQGLAEGRTARRGLGYPQVIAMLEGRLTEGEARRDIVAATRRYARRQQRWFRRDPRTCWVSPSADASSTAQLILDRCPALTRTLGA